MIRSGNVRCHLFPGCEGESREKKSQTARDTVLRRLGLSTNQLVDLQKLSGMSRLTRHHNPSLPILALTLWRAVGRLPTSAAPWSRCFSMFVFLG